MAAERKAVKRKQEGVDDDHGRKSRTQTGRDQDNGSHHPGR